MVLIYLISGHYRWFDVASRNRHVFKNLKVLEINMTWECSLDAEEDPENLAVRFIEFCPQLESSHLKMALMKDVPNDKFRHENLTNLVITYADFHRFKIY